MLSKWKIFSYKIEILTQLWTTILGFLMKKKGQPNMINVLIHIFSFDTHAHPIWAENSNKKNKQNNQPGSDNYFH